MLRDELLYQLKQGTTASPSKVGNPASSSTCQEDVADSQSPNPSEDNIFWNDSPISTT